MLLQNSLLGGTSHEKTFQNDLVSF